MASADSTCPFFEVSASCGTARAGRLLGKVETPAAMMYTRRGFPSPFTLNDLNHLGTSTGTLMQMSVADFIDAPGDETLSQFDEGLKEFCGMKGRGESLIVTLRDAFNTQTGMPASDPWVTVQSAGGQKKLEHDRFISMLAAMRPDIAECLSDEILSDASQKRVKKSVDRCIQWCDACVKAKSNGTLPSTLRLFAPIGGGVCEKERTRSAEEAAKKDVDGFSICGMGAGESKDERIDLARKVIALLPVDKPRLIHGAGSPEEVLELAACGIDIFETAYPAIVSDQGAAIVYSVSFDEVMNDAEGNDALIAEHTLCGKLNLRDTLHAKDTRPILQGCACFACVKHTRAYIHHLINTHEILGDVLLHTHNHHHFARFFSGLRESIRQGKLADFTQRFLAKRKHTANQGS